MVAVLGLGVFGAVSCNPHCTGIFRSALAFDLLAPDAAI